MSNVIYISRLFSRDTNKLYTDIAFLTVNKSEVKDAIGIYYYVVESEDERFFLTERPSIVRTFYKGLKINNWDEPIFFDRPFNYLYKIGNDDPNTKYIIELIFREE